jgi:hypothetical protein
MALVVPANAGLLIAAVDSASGMMTRSEVFADGALAGQVVLVTAGGTGLG